MKIEEKTIQVIELEEEEKEVFRKAYALMKKMCQACNCCEDCPCQERDYSSRCKKDEMEDILQTLGIEEE